jgi:homoaconitate hydratase
VTALQAKGLPLVIAGSFSQTYLRNAFNNGFLCIESPEFVKWLKKVFAPRVEAKEKTIIPEIELAIDFRTGTITCMEDKFQFPPLGAVPQALVIAGGVEKLVGRRLGLAAVKA